MAQRVSILMCVFVSTYRLIYLNIVFIIACLLAKFVLTKMYTEFHRKKLKKKKKEAKCGSVFEWASRDWLYQTGQIVLRTIEFNSHGKLLFFVIVCIGGGGTIADGLFFLF